MLPCAPKEERSSAWRRRRGVVEVIMQLHLGGYARGFKEEARDG